MRNFSSIKRIVVKIGTKTLSPGNGVDQVYLEHLADQVKVLKARGLQVLIVSSGAIGAGSKRLQLTSRTRDIKLRQACAAVGQPLLMNSYARAFDPRDIIVSQVLVTRKNFNDRETFLTLKDALETMLDRGVVPVFNENDCISTREIGPVFGDNDSLSAHIASKLDAELLVLLSDIDALYDGDPRKNSNARPIPVVDELTDAIKAGAGGAGSEYATGGMTTKLKAVEIARRAGCRVILANGREDNILVRLMDGEILGTLFLAGEKVSSRRRWIHNAEPTGTIYVDKGAESALGRRKSLLPSGITGIEGIFKAGDVVFINSSFKAITALNSSEIKEVAGKHSSEIQQLLGENHREEVAVPEDIVALE